MDLLLATDPGLFVNTPAMFKLCGVTPGVGRIPVEIYFEDGRTLKTVLEDGKAFDLPDEFSSAKPTKVAVLQ